ncbi:after-VIT domain-containing protein [Microcoleus sp. OTE_8_concoct_300]|uniref:after-VIT domain-containing protein n=1 Tax=Microcoleus sp. OTE_8_concoct_300 TaxID=2964710 RepID=UPI00403F0B7F
MLNYLFLSDGYIGNENEVLAEVQQHLKSGNRLYSFGAGSSVNRFLLDRLAEIGRGISRIVRHDEAVNEFVEKFFRQINNPVLVNLEITWQGEGENPVIYPSVAPDLFAEQPLVLFGKKGDRQAGTLQIKGVSAGGHQYVQTYEMNFTDPGNPAVAQLWGRHRIKDLMNQMVQYETKVGVETVTETALTYQLLSQYTAFVAVSDDVRVEPGTESISMNVPVEMPEAVEYEGVFGNTGYLQLKRMSRGSAPVARSMQYLADEEDAEIERGISLSSFPEMLCEASAPSKARPRGTSPVEVVSAAGLDEVARDSLNEHLESLTVPRGINGELVLEIVFGKVRASRIVVDAEASTVADVELLKIIKKWLFSWRIPQSITKKWLFSWRIPHSIENPVRLTLRVRS